MWARVHRTSRPIEPHNTTILILGDGRSLPQDLKRFLTWEVPHDVGCIGRRIKMYPGDVRHWFDCDAAATMAWAKSIDSGVIKHTCGDFDGFDVDWDVEQKDYHYAEQTGEKTARNHGSTALFATLAAIEMGYQKIVLAGCPLDTEGHWYFEPAPDTMGPIWLGYDFMAWLDFSESPEASGVKSMSGYTAKILGEAVRSWAH